MKEKCESNRSEAGIYRERYAHGRRRAVRDCQRTFGKASRISIFRVRNKAATSRSMPSALAPVVEPPFLMMCTYIQTSIYDFNSSKALNTVVGEVFSMMHTYMRGVFNGEMMCTCIQTCIYGFNLSKASKKRPRSLRSRCPRSTRPSRPPSRGNKR